MVSSFRKHSNSTPVTVHNHCLRSTTTEYIEIALKAVNGGNARGQKDTCSSRKDNIVFASEMNSISKSHFTPISQTIKFIADDDLRDISYVSFQVK